MRTSAGACTASRSQGQKATDELAYVVEENVLAWRIVRLHGAEPSQASRFARASSDAAPPLDEESIVAASIDDADHAGAGRRSRSPR